MAEFSALLTDLERNAGDQAVKDAIYYRCATDLALFSAYYFPHYAEYPFNTFHYDRFEAFSLAERAIRRVWAAPRGSAKSSLAALIEPIHDICYRLEEFILIISNTNPQALGKLKDIRAELLTNDMLVNDYGISFSTKKPAESQFIVLQDGHEIMLAAYGSGAEIRGIRFRHKRPTKIICDDSEHSEKVFN